MNQEISILIALYFECTEYIKLLKNNNRTLKLK